MSMSKNNILNLNTQSVLSMRSSGYYSKKTIGAKIAIDATKILMKKAINEIPKMKILRMADFGSADGGTSQEMWFKLINNIRKKKILDKLKYYIQILLQMIFRHYLEVCKECKVIQNYHFKKNFLIFLFMVAGQVFINN